MASASLHCSSSDDPSVNVTTYGTTPAQSYICVRLNAENRDAPIVILPDGSASAIYARVLATLLVQAAEKQEAQIAASVELTPDQAAQALGAFVAQKGGA